MLSQVSLSHPSFCATAAALTVQTPLHRNLALQESLAQERAC